ncbi:MAG: DUF2271 domain-containing protein [Verrucomicrobiota bacterium JB023]|nr:DUF2271 domain-containing protein [Verrucomicrobiota bacterium JB023]
MKNTLLFSLSGMAVSLAGDYELSIEIPSLDVSEYHRPYVAAWIEDDSRDHVMDLALWYEMAKKNGHGEKWLKDIRKWWRVSGRSLEFPVEGFSGPTQPPGTHTVSLKDYLAKLPAAPDKVYKLYVEASREVGGREMLAIPFTWDGETLTVKADEPVQGKNELGEISVQPSQS